MCQTSSPAQSRICYSPTSQAGMRWVTRDADHVLVRLWEPTSENTVDRGTPGSADMDRRPRFRQETRAAIHHNPRASRGRIQRCPDSTCDSDQSEQNEPRPRQSHPTSSPIESSGTSRAIRRTQLCMRPDRSSNDLRLRKSQNNRFSTPRWRVQRRIDASRAVSLGTERALEDRATRRRRDSSRCAG